MPTFGLRPDDFVRDARGDIQIDLKQTFYATRTDAEMQTNPLGSVTTRKDGRWEFTNDATGVFGRDPDGNIRFYDSEEPKLTQAAASAYAVRRDVDRSFGALPTVMATPPTVTLGAVGANPTITTPQDVPYNSPLVRTIGGRTVRVNQYSVDYLACAVNSANIAVDGTPGAQYAEPPFAVEFMHDGSDFEVAIKSQTAAPGAHYRLVIDGQYAAAAPVAPTLSGGSRYYLKVSFGSRAIRRVRIELNRIHFGGLKIGSTESVWVPDRPASPRAVFLGDSLTAGVGGATAYASWAYQASRLLDWRDPVLAGQGGTGYLNNAGGANGLQTFTQRLTNDVVNVNPDVLVVFGGINDLTSSGFTDAQLRDACAALFARIKAELPNTRTYIVGCWKPVGGPYAAIDTAIATMSAQAAAAGLPFINTDGWITGTGKVGATTASGNGNVYVQNDGVHPTDMGHAYIARRFAQAVQSIGVF